MYIEERVGYIVWHTKEAREAEIELLHNLVPCKNT